MKKKNLQNDNGITICDSIVMSVKKKRFNMRKAEAVAIAVIGYVSAIMSFIGMFDFNFNHKSVAFSAVFFSIVYIFLALTAKKTIWIVWATFIAGCAVSYKMIDTLSMGYKYVFNVIYRKAMYTDIDYYKFLRPEFEESSVTTLFVVGTWGLAIIIYMFTVYHPNSIPPLIVTFPLIETGLYNGIEISVFWGMLLVAYWFAVFAMTAIDMGEYSGGKGGFVRKENIFFPKRQMKLKVTEKCGMYVIAVVFTVTAVTSFVLDMIVYERSEKINQKRFEIRDAVSSFSSDDLAGSISELTSAFGFTFKIQSHKLGNVDRLKYKNSTDLIVTFNQKYNNGAVYLKEYTGSVYNNNQWDILPDSAYNQPIFDDFEEYGTYPQDFPYRFSNDVNVYDSVKNEYIIEINSKLRRNRSFSPYGTDNIGIKEYEYDNNVTSKSGNVYSYKFTGVDANDIATKLDHFVSSERGYNIKSYSGQAWENQLADYVSDKNILADNNFSIANGRFIGATAGTALAELIENDYRSFVYENYLQLPDTEDIAEIRQEFADILDTAHGSDERSKVAILTALRDKVSSMTEYSLIPGRTPATRDFVNYFLLENNKGYCVHYATAGVILARMAGIPARYATGYVIVGDDFNEDTMNADGSYTITLQDSRSHAWIEIYMDGYGWVPFEFTAGYSNQTIDTTPTTTTTTATTSTVSTETTSVELTESNEVTTQENIQITTLSLVPESAYETTVVTVTTVVGGGESIVKHTPKALKYVIYTITAVVLTALLLYIRRLIILFIRRKHFSDGSRKSRMQYIYLYAEKLLKYLKIRQDNMEYAEFSALVENSAGGVYFVNGEFKEFMNIALKSTFSEYPPENDELNKCLKFTRRFAKEIYNKSDTAHRIYMKIVVVII